mgnify:FL=1
MKNEKKIGYDTIGMLLGASIATMFSIVSGSITGKYPFITDKEDVYEVTTEKFP